MGLINSGDFFNMITDESIHDIKGVLKSVDDCLAQVVADGGKDRVWRLLDTWGI